MFLEASGQPNGLTVWVMARQGTAKLWGSPWKLHSQHFWNATRKEGMLTKGALYVSLSWDLCFRALCDLCNYTSASGALREFTAWPEPMAMTPERSLLNPGMPALLNIVLLTWYSKGREELSVRSDSSNLSAPSYPSQQSLEGLSVALRARVTGTWPVSVTTVIHHSALPVRNFLSLSELCPLVCPRWPLSPRGWEGEQAHLFNHNARVWEQFLPQPCFAEGWRSPDVTVLCKHFLFSIDFLCTPYSCSLLPHPTPGLRQFSHPPDSGSGKPFPTPRGQARLPYTCCAAPIPECLSQLLFSTYFCDNLINVCLPH